jgi:hypothetical protein
MPNPYQNPYGGGSSAYQYGPNPGQSGGDPRGRAQNQNQYQQQRYENQQGPMANAFAYNYGRGSESDYGNYTDIMNQYRNIASGGGAGAGGGGGGGGYSAFTVSPGKASYNDPFNSYKGYTEFSETGGYSPNDIANMRARGVSPIRSAYANAEREMGRGRALQGGYSPNMAASQVKMAREQGQSAADATQNVEAGLAEARNRGRLAGLSGMYGVENSRLGADVDLSKFNVGLDFEGQQYNADAQARAQAANIGSAESSAAASRAQQMQALNGMANLYGTTPGMSQLFGNQLLTAVGQGGQMGNTFTQNEIAAGRSPGAWDQTMNRIGGVMDLFSKGSTAAYPWLNDERQGQNQIPQGPGYTSGLPQGPMPGTQYPIPQVPRVPQYGYGDEPWRGGL